mmetsp:Transcript_3100/g.8142  ORF Transcript_3100/g.8142 Transcript_3100/m.8142 type:complete len:286 (+) Transcript_3100:54-911(+)
MCCAMGHGSHRARSSAGVDDRAPWRLAKVEVEARVFRADGKLAYVNAAVCAAKGRVEAVAGLVVGLAPDRVVAPADEELVVPAELHGRLEPWDVLHVDVAEGRAGQRPVDRLDRAHGEAQPPVGELAAEVAADEAHRIERLATRRGAVDERDPLHALDEPPVVDLVWESDDALVLPEAEREATVAVSAGGQDVDVDFGHAHAVDPLVEVAVARPGADVRDPHVAVAVRQQVDARVWPLGREGGRLVRVDRHVAVSHSAAVPGRDVVAANHARVLVEGRLVEVGVR